MGIKGFISLGPDRKAYLDLPDLSKEEANKLNLLLDATVMGNLRPRLVRILKDYCDSRSKGDSK